MSAVIAVCGTNFCTFAADRRMVIPDENTFLCANDETDKIFKVNDRVLLGMTGIFWRWEHLTGLHGSAQYVCGPSQGRSCSVFGSPQNDAVPTQKLFDRRDGVGIVCHSRSPLRQQNQSEQAHSPTTPV